MSYLNKWNQDIEAAFRDNRARGQDLITEITNAYAEYNTAYQTYVSYKETQDKMKNTGDLSDAEVKEKDTTAEQVAGFHAEAMQCNQTRDEFQAFMDRLTEDIEEKTEKFSHIEFYEASLRDRQYKDVATSQNPEVLQNLDERRKRLVQISSYYASFANIPPAPSEEPTLMQDFSINVDEVAKEALRNIEERQGAKEETTSPADEASYAHSEEAPSMESDIVPNSEGVPSQEHSGEEKQNGAIDDKTKEKEE